jgi:hypothetical protein
MGCHTCVADFADLHFWVCYTPPRWREQLFRIERIIDIMHFVGEWTP